MAYAYICTHQLYAAAYTIGKIYFIFQIYVYIYILFYLYLNYTNGKWNYGRMRPRPGILQVNKLDIAYNSHRLRKDSNGGSSCHNHVKIDEEHQQSRWQNHPEPTYKCFKGWGTWFGNTCDDLPTTLQYLHATWPHCPLAETSMDYARHCRWDTYQGKSWHLEPHWAYN